MQKIKNLKFDPLIFGVLACTIFLAAFGCVMVYSASSYSALIHYGSSTFFLTKQIIGALLGLVALTVMCFISHKKLIRLKWWLVGISAILLVLVFIPGIGIENYGARRWIGFAGITIQPSEIAKFALVIFVAIHLSQNYHSAKTTRTILPPLLVGGLFCALVITEPNMSITICLALVLFIMLFVGGLSKKHFFWLGSAGMVAIPALIILEPYRIKRLMAFVNPWASPQGEGFQLIQSLYAVGAGGLFGVGLGESRQKYLFLPFSESDFIFSIIAEEIGFIGCLCLLAVYALLVFLLIKIALRASNRFGALLVVGIASVIAVQTILNIAVISGSIPPTGLPLPFISAGSTSLVVFMAAIGIALNVHRESHPNSPQSQH